MIDSNAERPIRWWVPPATFALSVLIGSVLGAATNVGNSFISPDYFRIVMNWWAIPDVRVYAITQGAIEGAVLGGAFGIFIAIAGAFITRLRGTLTLTSGALLLAYCVVFVCWVLGGVTGVVFASVAPQTFMDMVMVRNMPRTTLLRFAWVGGSIWGAYGGTLIAMVAGVIFLRRRWVIVGKAAPAFSIVPVP